MCHHLSNMSWEKISRHKFLAMKTCLIVNSYAQPLQPLLLLAINPSPVTSHLPPLLLLAINPSPATGHLPPLLLALKLTPSSTEVIFHPCWRLTWPLLAQRSSSTPAGGQTHPSQPSSYLPYLLVVNFNPPQSPPSSHLSSNPSCWLSTSPFPLAIGVSRGGG